MKKQISSSFGFIIFIILFTQCASVKKTKLAEKNIETVRVWFEEGWNKSRNLELVERCFEPDWSDGNPLRGDQVMGHEGIRQMVVDFRDGLTKPHFSITHLYASGFFVTVRYEMSAIHSGDLFGIPATGKTFVATGIVIYEMKNERIVTTWAELDVIGILNQLKD